MEHARVIHTLFGEKLSGLKQTALPQITHPVPISAQPHLPINPGWQAAAQGTTPPLCVPPTGAEPPEGFNEDRQEVGEDGRSRKWPHIDSGIQRTENRFIGELGMRIAGKYPFISVPSGEITLKYKSAFCYFGRLISTLKKNNFSQVKRLKHIYLL